MKIIVAAFAIFLFALSGNATADSNAPQTEALTELQTKIVLNAGNIKTAFEKHHFKTDKGVYSDIWAAEFAISDSITVTVNTVELFKELPSERRSNLAKIRVSQIIDVALLGCKKNLFDLHESQASMIDPDMRNSVGKQVGYAIEACESIDLIKEILR